MRLDEGIELASVISEMVSPVGWLLKNIVTETATDPNFGDPSLRPAIALIPLGLSERGIRAIKGAGVPGLLEDVLDNSRPIYTRMVHMGNEDGSHIQVPMPYGANGEAGDVKTSLGTSITCVAVSSYLASREDCKASLISAPERTQRNRYLQP